MTEKLISKEWSDLSARISHYNTQEFGQWSNCMEDIESFILKNRQDLLTELLAKAESMDTAREVRHLIKEYIFHD